MLNYIWETTQTYLNNMPKSERKKKGQFFTSRETAKYMADLFSPATTPAISILDPGAGTGLLTAAVVERFATEVQTIHLTCYETDQQVLPILQKNLSYIKNHSKAQITYEILQEDYLLSQANDFEETLMAKQAPPKYDYIIGNPPYLRIPKTHEASQAMPRVIHGAPNLYFLFAAMSLFNLKPNAEMVYIIPRSWTSGLYFQAFREYFLQNGKLEHIHLFVSRDKVFQKEQVLQETMILKMQKTPKTPSTIQLSSCNSSLDFEHSTILELPYDTVVVGKQKYVFLPTNQTEIAAIQQIHRYQQTLPDIGIKMKTGIVVDFRQRQNLHFVKAPGTVPLFYSRHIKNGRVSHDSIENECDWIDSDTNLVQDNKNYIFCKRFTTKEESRRLQCGIYLSSDYKNYSQIGTHNKINFIETIDKTPFSDEELYGVFALLNSTLFDTYYRILNGSTQVNSTEINNIPVPPLAIIRALGQKLIQAQDLTTKSCDRILSEVAYD